MGVKVPHSPPNIAERVAIRPVGSERVPGIFLRIDHRDFAVCSRNVVEVIKDTIRICNFSLGDLV